MFNLVMRYTRYIFSNLQTPYQKIRNQRFKSDLWCCNDYFFILDNSCCNDILLVIATYVVMTYWLLLHTMLLYDAWWYDIPYHDIMPVVLTYNAMTYYLRKHNMLRHTASCSKYYAMTLYAVCHNTWQSACCVMACNIICCDIASFCCCNIPWYDALYVVEL